MRKVFWGSTACAVLVVVGVVAAANHAAHHPHSFIGRVLHGASYAAGRLSPAARLAGALARTQCTSPDVIASVEGIPDEPEAVPEQAAGPAEIKDWENKLPELQPEHEEPSAAPIVIPEDDNSQARISPPPMPGTIEFHPDAPFDPQTECPPPSGNLAPPTMPRCHDEEQCEVLPMPTEVEMLPMPSVEELPMPTAEEEQEFGLEEPDKCHEDCTGQHHDSGCPHMSQPPASEPSDGGEEASEPRSSSKSALKKILRFKARHPMDEACPVHPEVDTMEYRASDGQLYDYGPGEL
jgi:hypothetical protein